ncbi:MAG: NifU family protein [Alphaproteobacteria bacterium]|nr:NifU family protein [Alphaproteobacteria bacterium]
MRIETQASPDENIMHFYPENGLNIKNSAKYIDIKSIRKSSLAENLFDLGGINAVLITPDSVSVTKNDDVSWGDIKPLVLAEIMDFLTSGAQIVIEDESEKEEDLIEKINGLLNARIRPAIQRDGGDIVLRKFEGGIAYVELQGKCVGCPYAQRTLKDGVEKILKTYIPEVKAVEKYEN